MTLSTFCTNAQGYPKEKFASEQAAKQALREKRRFRNRRYPHLYSCPSCHGWHLTGSVAA